MYPSLKKADLIRALNENYVGPHTCPQSSLMYVLTLHIHNLSAQWCWWWAAATIALVVVVVVVVVGGGGGGGGGGGATAAVVVVALAAIMNMILK
jgi:hypothetical protein